MSTDTHAFCRTYLKEVMKDVRKVVSPDIIKHAWGYKYQSSDSVEFHINKCDELPVSFYWHGQGCCVWHAKAEGWSNFLESIEGESK